MRKMASIQKILEEEYIGKTMIFIGASNDQITYSGGSDPRKFFSLGEEVIVTNADVYSWKTFLEFKGFPNKQFNSVCFEFKE